VITTRLNKLITAYRAARKLIGDANRGKAIPAVAFRWCHRIRQAIRAEIQVVEAVIRPERLLPDPCSNRMNTERKIKQAYQAAS